MIIKETRTIQLPMERELYLTNDITCEGITEIIKSINTIRSSDISISKEYKNMGAKYKPSPIILYINSYGGEVYPALGLVALMLEQKGNKNFLRTPIDTFCLGIAGSAAAIISLCGRNRYCTPLSTFMLHEISSIIWDKTRSIVTGANEIIRLQEVMDNIIINHSNITMEMIEEKYSKKGDWWINALEAKELNMVKDILI
jgi:ATP-dependent Clp protease, protease subunit